MYTKQRTIRLHYHPGVTLRSYEYGWILGAFRRLAKKPKVMHARRTLLVRHL